MSPQGWVMIDSHGIKLSQGTAPCPGAPCWRSGGSWRFCPFSAHHCRAAMQRGKVTYKKLEVLFPWGSSKQDAARSPPSLSNCLLMRIWRSQWYKNREGWMYPFVLVWQNKINCIQGIWEIDINISERSKFKIFKCYFKRMLDHLRILILNRRITEAANDLSSLFATGIRTKCHILGPCFMFASTRTDNLNVSYYSLSINFRI